MKKDRNSLFFSRCEKSNLVTKPICDRYGNILFNIHTYLAVYEGNDKSWMEVTAERNDEILCIILYTEDSGHCFEELQLSATMTATKILCKRDFKLFEGVDGYVKD